MKIFIFTIAAFITLNSFGQNSLANSQWKSTMLMPGAIDVKFIFKKDTLSITSETIPVIGTIFFFQRNDTLLIRKIDGPSPCPEDAQGLYLIQWIEKGRKFRLQPISDECEGRIGPFTLYPFEKL